MAELKSTWSVVSLFSGCGGFDLGAESTGKYSVVFANDNDHWAVETYKRNLGRYIVEGDARDLPIPDVSCDVLIAGPPCQDFSSLWNRDGVQTSRGNLFLEVSRFLYALRPAVFVLENVVGMLSANQGQAWTMVRQALRSPGALWGDKSGVRYRLRAEKINMADLGVPQVRERLIVIGVREDLKVPVPEVPRPFADQHVPVSRVLIDKPMPAEGVNFHDVGFDSDVVVERLKLIPPGSNYECIPNGHPLAVKGLISHVYKRLHPDEPSYTIIASGGGGTYGYHFSEPRRLSNRERARIQSFPDKFTFALPAGTPKIRQQATVRRLIGNAVPPVGANVIMEAVSQALLDSGVRKRTALEIIKMRTSSELMANSESRYTKIS